MPGACFKDLFFFCSFAFNDLSEEKKKERENEKEKKMMDFFVRKEDLELSTGEYGLQTSICI